MANGFDRSPQFSVTTLVEPLDKALKEIQIFDPQIVLLDMDSLRRGDALGIALATRRAHPNLVIIFMSERDTTAMAKEGMVSALYHHSYWLREPGREATTVLHEISRAYGGAKQIDESLLETTLTESHHHGLLSPQQHRVLRLMASGLSNSAIGQECQISTKAAERTIAMAAKLLGIDSSSPRINPRVMTSITYLKVMSFM